MNFTHTSHHIQQMPTGEDRLIHIYTSDPVTAEDAPVVYLQGNLHGPEIAGTAVLTKLMEYLQKPDAPELNCQLIIVPCANPIGVNSTGYNAHQGRWNDATGKNWNRIFDAKTRFTSRAAKQEHFKEILSSGKALSVEKRLGAMLQYLSAQADVVVDLHTSGSTNHTHLFTHPEAHGLFSALEAPVHIEWKEEVAIDAMDEQAHLGTKGSDELPTYACTWEVHNHGEITDEIVDERFQQLLQLLKNISEDYAGAVQKKLSADQHIVGLSQMVEISAPMGGYYSFSVKEGDVVKAGEQYAQVAQPQTGKTLPVVAENDMLILGLYGVRAIAQGQPLLLAITQ